MEGKVPNDYGFARRLFLSLSYFIQLYLTGLKYMVQHIFTHYSKLNEIPNRCGETAIVTGGARGIGKEIVKQLLKADMRVFIACRDTSKGNTVIKECRDLGITTGTAECIQLDLCSLCSVREFANTFTKMDVPLHLLVNNAGIMGVPYKLTGDGFESHFQINYLSHYLLTVLLLPALIRGGNGSEHRCSRIVNVSSMVQYMGKIDLNDLVMKKFFDRHAAYCNTKLMQVASSCYMNERFLNENLPIRAYSVHPGLVRTELFKHSPLYIIMKHVLRIGAKTAEQGADTIVYVAFSEEIEERGGTFLHNCKIISPNIQAENVEVQNKLWEMSLNLTKLEERHPQSTTTVSDPIIMMDME